MSRVCKTAWQDGNALRSGAAQLAALREEVGEFGTLLYAGKDWKDPDLARRSMVLMSGKVMPQLG